MLANYWQQNLQFFNFFYDEKFLLLKVNAVYANCIADHCDDKEIKENHTYLRAGNFQDKLFVKRVNLTSDMLLIRIFSH